MNSDAELLARYVASRSQRDFAEIIARHGPMVLRTCLRLTGNPSDAEDAAQAVFLVLSQKCAAIKENLAGWLYKVAQDGAHEVVRARRRRARREEKKAQQQKAQQKQAQMARSTPLPDIDLREELDAALVRLPVQERMAVVLRYLEDRDYAEAARMAGCTEATMRWRAMKGLDRLRSVLARRGAVFSVAALATFLAQEAAASVPATQLLGWAAALTAGTAAGTAVSTGATAAAQSVMQGMLWAKVKMYAMVAASLTVAVTAAAPLVIPSGPATASVSVAPANPVQLGVNASLGGKRPFPDDNPWNQDISREPVDPNSATFIASLGRDKTLFPDLGTPLRGKDFSRGIPYIVVGGEQPPVPIRFTWLKKDSDPGPYPIPDNLPFESGADTSRGIILDRDNWTLYEIGSPERDRSGWQANMGAKWDLKTNKDRPLGWSSTDAAGLPVFPGLIRYDEVREQKAIHHALRFTASRIRRACVPPARHFGGEITDANAPPMGMRVRLRADFDVSSFPPDAQVILTALKTYGMFLAEHGKDWYLSGTSDSRWNDADLKTLQRVQGRDFEVVRMGKMHTDR
jgi:RNA polymerase sigma factor (sigma-70 family)